VTEEKSRQTRAEKKATKKFDAESQKAVDGVDWGRVKVKVGRV
jgi:hypothetical protein